MRLKLPPTCLDNDDRLVELLTVNLPDVIPDGARYTVRLEAAENRADGLYRLILYVDDESCGRFTAIAPLERDVDGRLQICFDCWTEHRSDVCVEMNRPNYRETRQ